MDEPNDAKKRFNNLLSMPGAIEFVTALKDNGYEVFDLKYLHATVEKMVREAEQRQIDSVNERYVVFEREKWEEYRAQQRDATDHRTQVLNDVSEGLKKVENILDSVSETVKENSSFWDRMWRERNAPSSEE